MELVKKDVIMWPSHISATIGTEGVCFETPQGDMAFTIPTKDGRAFKISPDCSGYDAWMKAPYGTKFQAELI